MSFNSTVILNPEALSSSGSKTIRLLQGFYKGVLYEFIGCFGGLGDLAGKVIRYISSSIGGHRQVITNISLLACNRSCSVPPGVCRDT